MRYPAYRFVRRAMMIGAAALATLWNAPAGAYSGQFDGGGRLGDYLNLVSAADDRGQAIEIGGVCASACTAKLGARDVCVRSDAQLLFHAARDPDGRINALGTLMLLQEYPRAIRAWAVSHGALESLRFTGMSGSQAIALGVRRCGDTPVAPSLRAAVEARFTPRPAVAACFGQAAACASPFPSERVDAASSRLADARPLSPGFSSGRWGGR